MFMHKTRMQKILGSRKRSIKRCAPHGVRGLTKAAVLNHDEESTARISHSALRLKRVDLKKLESRRCGGMRGTYT
jgi:hypothetical protein